MSAPPDGIAKRAIVTGGSTGIGVAILNTLLADGYEVVNLSRRPAGIEHARLTSVSVDLTDGAATMAQNFALEPWETEAGYVLTCQAHPTTPTVTVD